MLLMDCFNENLMKKTPALSHLDTNCNKTLYASGNTKTALQKVGGRSSSRAHKMVVLITVTTNGVASDIQNV